MREIKFRAWSTRGEPKMIQLVDGKIGGRLNDLQEEDDWKVMQYTGLKDKNGVEIYEHDIVKILYSDWPSQLDSYPELSHDEYLDSLTYKGIVVWDQYGFWLVDKIGGYPQSISHGQHGYIEVIGNIYEHPELLEQS